MDKTEEEIAKELIGLTQTKEQLHFLTGVLEQRALSSSLAMEVINNLLDRLERRR